MFIKPKQGIYWSKEFAPSYTPLEMLMLGVFEGKYINEIKEIPIAWKIKAKNKIVKKNHPADISLNKYGVKSRKPLSHWKSQGWLMTDKEGWFGWYIRYYLGRRLGREDDIQIKRWKSFIARHSSQIKYNVPLNDHTTRLRQRQALLQWAWDSSTEYSLGTLQKNLIKIKQELKIEVM